MQKDMIDVRVMTTFSKPKINASPQPSLVTNHVLSFKVAGIFCTFAFVIRIRKALCDSGS